MHWKPLFEDSRPGSKSDIYICIGTTHKTFRTSSEQRENVRSSMGLKRSDFPTCWEVSAALQRTDLRSLPPLHVQKLTQQLKTFEGYRLMSIESKSFHFQEPKLVTAEQLWTADHATIAKINLLP